jgi:transaldolase
MTIPVGAASDARARLSGKWESRVGRTYGVRLAPGVDERKLRLSVLWDVTEKEKELGRSLNANPPHTADELVARARRLGAGDMFMQLGPGEADQIAREGKIPKHASWAQRIAAGDTAADTLLNLAGLASFAADQKALDDRVRGLVSR